MKTDHRPTEDRIHAAQFPESPDALDDEPRDAEVKAWELVDPKSGRYMPRRIRGSMRGRALG